MIEIAHTAGKMLSVLELEILYMLWTMLRWNLGNTSAIAAFCLLPIITFGDANFNDRQPTEVTPFAKLQNGNIELTAFAQNACANHTPSRAPSNADDRRLDADHPFRVARPMPL